MVHKEKRQNIGGCHLRNDEFATDFEIVASPESIVHELLSYIDFEVEIDSNILKDFLTELQNFSSQNQPKGPNIPHGLRNIQNINHYFQNYNPMWNFLKSNHCELIDVYIRTYNTEKALEYLDELGFSQSQVLNIIEKGKEYIVKLAPWNQAEDKFHINYSSK